jgi:hypothetical protein
MCVRGLNRVARAQVGGVLNAIEAKLNIFDWSGDDTEARPQVCVAPGFCVA